jgi:cytochrome c oxidase subunit III
MATTLQPPPIVKVPAAIRRVEEFDSDAPSTGIWIGLAAITMTFAAFTSAMVVRQGSANDWRHFSFPAILYLNTLTLVASSVTVHIARRRFAAFVPQSEQSAAVLRGLYGTLLLGLMFVAGQYAAWHQLRSEGLYLASTPSSSFFYIFTVLHALHVIGGVCGLFYVIGKVRRGVLRRNTLDAASRYWHFMGVLWLYLLFVLWLRI